MKIFLLLCSLLAGWSSSIYGCSEIILVSSASHLAYIHRLEALLFNNLPPGKQLISINPQHIQGRHFFHKYSDPCLILAVGSKALASVLATDTTIPVLNTLTRKNSFHHLLKQYHRPLNEPHCPISAIYIDHPLERQFDLIVRLFPDKALREPIGVVLGPESMIEYQALQKISKDKKMALMLVNINKTENPISILDQLASEAKCLLAIPDNTIYNAKTSHGILLTSFNKRVPLIGYSQAFVSNGAIAAVYSTTRQLAEHTAETILTTIADKKLPPPQYPKTYSIALNHQQLHSLGISQ